MRGNDPALLNSVADQVKTEVAQVPSVVDLGLSTKGQKPEVKDTATYDNGTKVVPAYLLQPVSVDKSNYKQVLVDGGYYTEGDLK